MFKFRMKPLTALTLMSLMCSTAASVHAQTTVGGNVNLTVNNAISITETTPMNFGTYLVVKDTASTQTATLTMASNGTATPATSGAPAVFTSVSATGRTQGVFTITGAAPSTVINVSTTNLVDLNCSACVSSDDITLTSVTPAAATVTTDGSGDATINVGAVLTTKTGGNQYKSGSYVGTYDLVVNY